MTAVDPAGRFSSRAPYYAAGRAGYPDSVMEYLGRDPGLAPHAVVVDVGSGTGLSAELFLRHGHTVYAVEPNPEMRRVAEEQLRGRPGFHSVEGRAEAAPLPDEVADLVVCASAFHWFRPREARREFRRLLRPGGAVAILRNGRNGKRSPFMRAYAQLFRRHAARVRDHANREGSVRDFFAGKPYSTAMLAYEEQLDFEVLRSRLLSYSTVPLPGDPGHEPMLAELRRLFDAAAQDGRVIFLGEVTLHVGRLD